MKKEHLSQQEMAEMFNLITFRKLLCNVKKTIDNFDEAQDPIKQLGYIFRVLTNFFEKISKNLETYERDYERVSLSNAYQRTVFENFCCAIGAIDSRKERVLGKFADKERLEFSVKVKEAKKIHEQLFKINNEMYLYIRDIEKNSVDFLKIKEAVDAAYSLITEYSKDKKLEKAELLVNESIIFSLAGKLVRNIRIREKQKELALIEQKVDELNEKTGNLVVKLYNKEKAHFYDVQIECCLNIMEKIYRVSCMDELIKKQDDHKFLIVKRLMNSTVDLMSKYHDEMKKEYDWQHRYVFGTRSSLGRMDEREVEYLKKVLKILEEIKEKSNLESLPVFLEHTDAFNRFLDVLSISEVSDRMSAVRLSPR